MLQRKSKWDGVFEVFEATRRYSRALEERENRARRNDLLIFLLLIALVSFMILIWRSH